MKEFDYSQVKDYKFYDFAKNGFGWLIKAIFRMKFKGTENIPEKGGYILAVNHVSLVDPFFVALPKRMHKLHFMAKAELFSNSVMSWLVTHLNGFPVRRGKGDTAAIDYGIKVLEEGHVMAICPEGKRIKDMGGVPQKPKAGVAAIAKATGADILPVAIYSDGNIKPFKRVTVVYGELIKNESLGMSEESTPREIKNAAMMIMSKITELWEKEKNGSNIG